MNQAADNEDSGFYDDDGDAINPDLIAKPGLCLTCGKEDAGEKEEMSCTLTRYGQRKEKSFECGAYDLKFFEWCLECFINRKSLCFVMIAKGKAEICDGKKIEIF